MLEKNKTRQRYYLSYPHYVFDKFDVFDVFYAKLLLISWHHHDPNVYIVSVITLLFSSQA